MGRQLRWIPLVGVLVAACGKGTEPNPPNPPPTNVVATVEVAPPSASLQVPETVQLTATPKTSAGAVVAGKTATWSSSAASVASVSGAGLVTAVGAGTATISASIDGKTGTATVAVTQVLGGPVVAQGTIGAAGGTVGTADVGVSVAAGAFTASRTITIIRDTLTENEFGTNSASALFRLDGFPSATATDVRVRIRLTKPLEGQGAIVAGRPTLVQGDVDTTLMGYWFHQATESSGYLVATIPITGRAVASNGPAAAAGKIDIPSFAEAAVVSGLINVVRQPSSAGHFAGWGLGGGAITADIARRLDKTLRYMEEAHTAISGLGYTFAHRTAWPMQVYVTNAMPANWLGAYYAASAWPIDRNAGYIAMRANKVDEPFFGGTAIHEFFHFTQWGFQNPADWTSYGARNWFNEAASTWMEGSHPSVAQPYNAPIAMGWRDSLYAGFSASMTGSSGYGRAPLLKYVEDRWGKAKVREMYVSMQNGMTPIAAFLANIPEPPAVWWPDLLTKLLTGTLYPWPPNQVLPNEDPTDPFAAMQPLDVYTDALPVAIDLNGLGANIQRIRRDSTRFGPQYQLPVYLETGAASGELLLLVGPANGTAHHAKIGQGDTVLVPATALRDYTRSILVVVAQTAPVAPYQTTTPFDLVADLRLPEGDYYFPTFRDLNDGVRITCVPANLTETVDIEDNAESIFSLMSQGGTWKRKAPVGTAVPTYEWTPTPEFADTLRKYQFTLASVAGLKSRVHDSVIVTARMTLNWSATTAPQPAVPARINWIWLLVPASALPFLFRRRRRWLAAAVPLVMTFSLVACGVGLISYTWDESFELRFGKFRYTADPANPNSVQLALTEGRGTTTFTNYRSEHWVYIKDAQGNKTDSTKTTCTGTGSATYRLDGAVYPDGVKPPTAPTVVDILSRATGIDRDRIAERVKPPF